MELYILDVKSKPAIPIEPLPELTEFSPMSYQHRELRNPFTAPQPEASVIAATGTKEKIDCAQDIEVRDKELLEHYALANLIMKGIVGKDGKLWALIQTPDGQSVQVGLNEYMGLDQGRVIRITHTSISLLETIADGKGCWITRNTELNMVNPNDKQG